MFAMPSLDDCLRKAIAPVTQALRTIPFTCVAEWENTCRQAFAAACSNTACPVCGIYFDSRRAVKVHSARAHASSTEDTAMTPSAVVPCDGSQTVRGIAVACSPSVNMQSAQSSVHDPSRLMLGFLQTLVNPFSSSRRLPMPVGARMGE